MAQPVKLKKSDLLERLKAQRPRLEAIDAKNLAKHQADEEKYHKEFVARCVKLSKMSYKQLKAAQERPGVYTASAHWSPPGCPISQVSQLDRLIAVIEATTQQRFTITANGDWSNAWHYIMADAPKTRKVC